MSFRSRFFPCAVLSAAALTASAGAWAQADDADGAGLSPTGRNLAAAVETANRCAWRLHERLVASGLEGDALEAALLAQRPEFCAEEEAALEAFDLPDFATDQ